MEHPVVPVDRAAMGGRHAGRADRVLDGYPPTSSIDSWLRWEEVSRRSSVNEMADSGPAAVSMIRRSTCLYRHAEPADSRRLGRTAARLRRIVNTYTACARDALGYG